MWLAVSISICARGMLPATVGRLNGRRVRAHFAAARRPQPFVVRRFALDHCAVLVTALMPRSSAHIDGRHFTPDLLTLRIGRTAQLLAHDKRA
jgi:hypothetical protein